QFSQSGRMHPCRQEGAAWNLPLIWSHCSVSVFCVGVWVCGCVCVCVCVCGCVCVCVCVCVCECVCGFKHMRVSYSMILYFFLYFDVFLCFCVLCFGN